MDREENSKRLTSRRRGNKRLGKKIPVFQYSITVEGEVRDLKLLFQFADL